jgi:cell division protein FtsB
MAALVVSVVLVGVLFVGVLPTRSFLAQRAATRKAQHQVDALDAQDHDLKAQAKKLTTPAEIERLARAQYGMVRPGEQAFAVLPPKAPRIGLPDVWPFTGVEARLTSR